MKKVSKEEKTIYEFLGHTLGSDVAAINIGAYTGKVARNLCNNIKGKPHNFYLIEACPTNFKVLQKNCPNYNLYNLVISDINGVVPFYIRNHPNLEGSSQSNSLFKEFINTKEWGDKTKTIHIQSMTLDSFVEMIQIHKIDLLQLNCEGGEYKIFSTMPNCLDSIRFLYIQLHKKSDVFLNEKITELRNRIISDTENNSHIHLLLEKI
jgi:FkbM family methyltransferase